MSHNFLVFSLITKSTCIISSLITNFFGYNIITLGLGCIEQDHVISEPCYKAII